MSAPTEKKRNDEIAAIHGEPVDDGSMPSSSRVCVRKREVGILHQIRREALGELFVDAALHEDVSQLLTFGSGSSRSALRSTSISYSKSSFCERMERYSPLPIEKAPATRPARPASRTTAVTGIRAREAKDQRDVGDESVQETKERRAKSTV